MYTRPSAPRSVGAVFEDTIRLYQASVHGWWLASLLAALIGLPVSLYVERSLGPDPTLDGMLSLARSPAVWWLSALTLAGSVYLYCVMVRNINTVFLGGALTPASGFAAGLRVLPAALIATLVSILLTVGGTVLFLIPGIWLLGRLQFWPVVLMAEGGGAGGAILRSSRLVKGYWWHSSTVVSIAVLLLFLLGIVLNLTITALMAVTRHDAGATKLFSDTLGAVLQAAAAPLVAAAYVAAYYDLLLRHEHLGPDTRR